MPVYEYECTSCGHIFESVRPLALRDDPSACPDCESPGKRKFSVFGFRDGQYGHICAQVSSSKPSTEKPETPSTP
ncbi:MAG: zinc ribbon domain-containing protein [Dehalococcoidia bacterium]|nr:zinc ribbon domain-containing protein [Dehalococcoidia bacterium]